MIDRAQARASSMRDNDPQSARELTNATHFGRGVLSGGWAAHAHTMLGDAAQGWRLASEVCAACHRVDGAPAPSPVDGARDFDQIAQDARFSAIGVRVFLRTPHREMPNLMLSDGQIDDVIAYLDARRSALAD